MLLTHIATGTYGHTSQCSIDIGGSDCSLSICHTQSICRDGKNSGYKGLVLVSLARPTSRYFLSSID